MSKKPITPPVAEPIKTDAISEHIMEMAKNQAAEETKALRSGLRALLKRNKIMLTEEDEKRIFIESYSRIEMCQYAFQGLPNTEELRAAFARYCDATTTMLHHWELLRRRRLHDIGVKALVAKVGVLGPDLLAESADKKS